LAVIAQGVYEFAVDESVDGSDVTLTMLRAVGYLGARRDLTTIIGGAGPGIATPEAQLQTTLRYRLALYPHEGAWDEAEVWRQAAACQTPPRAVTTVPHPGEFAVSSEGIGVAGKNAVLSSIKQSEDGSALIVRLYNPSTETTQAIVTLPVRAAKAYRCNLEERIEAALTVSENRREIIIELPHKRIVTLRIETLTE
jgi:mannosylglycerate hydrolase